MTATARSLQSQQRRERLQGAENGRAGCLSPQRYVCPVCGYTNTTLRGISVHYEAAHRDVVVRCCCCTRKLFTFPAMVMGGAGDVARAHPTMYRSRLG